VILWLVIGCGSGVPPSDVAHYLQAVTTGEVSACSRIDAPDARGECFALAASALAERGQEDEAVGTCGRMRPGLWREECSFLVSDGLDAVHDRAEALCATAGRFAGQCRVHARSREERAPGVLSVED